MNLTPKGYGRVTFNGMGKILSTAEKITISATAATGTINYDVITQSVLYYTTASSGNFTVNLRGDGSNSMNNIMDTGESVTYTIVKTGSSAFTVFASQVQFA